MGARGRAPYQLPDRFEVNKGPRRQLIAVRMSQLVGMGHKGQTSQFARLGTFMAASRT
jgi:hypothetical protein